MLFSSEEEFLIAAQESRKTKDLFLIEGKKRTTRTHSKDNDKSSRIIDQSQIRDSYIKTIEHVLNHIDRKAYNKINRLELINLCLQKLETEIETFDFAKENSNFPRQIESRLNVTVIVYLAEFLDNPSMEVTQVFRYLYGCGLTLGKLYELAKSVEEMLNRGINVSMDLDGVIYYNGDDSFYYEGPLQEEIRIHYRLVSRFFGLQRYKKTKIKRWYYEI